MQTLSPQPRTDPQWQVQLADALGEFWCGAKDQVSSHDEVAYAAVCSVAEGLSAVAQRLREQAQGEVQP